MSGTAYPETWDNDLVHTQDKALERLWRLGRKPLFDFKVVIALLDENLASSWTKGELQFLLINRTLCETSEEASGPCRHL